VRRAKWVLVSALWALAVAAAPVGAGATETGQVLAWGAAIDGGSTCSTTGCQALPEPVTGFPSGPNVIDAGNTFSLAIAAGTVYAWGQNTEGQLGDGSVAASETPVAVLNVTRATGLADGEDFALALDATGQVWQWGNVPANGTDVLVPQVVTGLSNVVQVAAGGEHAMALEANGTVWAWGSGQDGELGTGTSRTSTPVEIPGLSGVKAISAGNLFGCAVLGTGTVDCWGNDAFGQLGTGNYTQQDLPTPVVGLTTVVAISAGGDNSLDGHTLALDAKGRVWAWGAGARGQLGQGNRTGSTVPLLVMGLPRVHRISAGGEHSMALDNQGHVFCWGSNDSGQIGNGGYPDALLPVQVTSGAIAIDAGSKHSLALLPLTLGARGANPGPNEAIRPAVPPAHSGRSVTASSSPTASASVNGS